MTRLTFVGDIACDKPLLKAAKARGKGKYDFSEVFHTEDVFAGADLVIGNLETCFGGGRRFNTKPYHYNSPDSFCTAIRDAGIGLVSTANNHCLDEGVEGAFRTLDLLDQHGIQHTGTFRNPEERRYLIREVNGVRIAFYSLTYSVNQNLETSNIHNLYEVVNLIGYRSNSGSLWMKRYWKYVFKPKVKQIVRKLRKQSTISARTDRYDPKLINDQWMDDIEKQISIARENSDLLVVLLHIGGQFNSEPGEFSKRIIDKLVSLGADIIIGNHPHTVQKVEERDGAIIAYSLGGFCMSTSGEYLVHDCLPEYSLALHIDIDEHNLTRRVSADILKGTENDVCYLNVNVADPATAGSEVIRQRIELN